MKKLKIALLYGGFSMEREIAIKTGKKIAENLNKKKYQVFLFDLKDDMAKFVSAAMTKKIDLVFPALHEPLSEDGTIQARECWKFSACRTFFPEFWRRHWLWIKTRPRKL
ncbi:MAG: D-alanine-D-alanine ligase [Parcubacteria group bacterium GW2011_GWA2_43_9b]|nr:MAG: D-alanine-D-alanine ligase [Parcubacteria group bacterium GW2011_GWA2_43_9b]